MKKTTPQSAIAKTAAGVGTVAAAVALGMLVKRQRVRATCKPFYSEAARCFKIPGLNEGFVPQDLFYLDDEKTWLFSGYEANRKPSPIFQVSEDGRVRRHEVLLPGGSLYRGHGAAITAAGPFGFGEHPAAVYSIPGNVQGLCVTPDGNIALSLAWGFGDAEIRIYDPARAHRGGSYMVEGHHCPLYFLDDATLMQTLTVPPMAEGIDTHDDQVYLANESASNLYLLGKFFGGSYVYSFPTS